MATTLKDALTQAGDHSQVDLLSHEAQHLTEQHITDFMNGKHDVNLTMGQVSSLRKLAKTRLANGQSVLPFKLTGLQQNESDDNIGGGFW